MNSGKIDYIDFCGGNCYIDFEFTGVLKDVGKCFGEEKKRRRRGAGATSIHKQVIDENLPIQPPGIDKRSQAGWIGKLNEKGIMR
jgi:hypothetical protein